MSSPIVDLSKLNRAAVGDDLDAVPVTRRMLRAIARELAEARWALAKMHSLNRVDDAVLDIGEHGSTVGRDTPL